MTEVGNMLDLTWKIKVGTIVLSIVAVGLEADAYTTWPQYGSEEYYIAVLCISIIFSFLLLAGSILGVIPRNDIWRKIDIGYHGGMAALLLLGWIMVVVSAANHSHSGWKAFSWYIKWQTETAFALIFGGINVGLYCVIAYLTSKQD